MKSQVSYLFRGDDNYVDGDVGRALGRDADEADIQNLADHVLRKESHLTSRYTSFTSETKIARRFSAFSDNRNVYKVDLSELQKLEMQGTIVIWEPDEVYTELSNGPKRLAKQASDVRAAMTKNCEILIEGLVPETLLEITK